MSGHSAESDVTEPRWAMGGRVISNHDAMRPGGRETPCFCWATEPHPEGQERVTPPAETDGAA